MRDVMVKSGLTLILQASFLSQLMLQTSETMLYSGNLYCMLIMILEALLEVEDLTIT